MSDGHKHAWERSPMYGGWVCGCGEFRDVSPATRSLWFDPVGPPLETCPRCGVTAPAELPCPTGCGVEDEDYDPATDPNYDGPADGEAWSGPIARNH